MDIDQEKVVAREVGIEYCALRRGDIDGVAELCGAPPSLSTVVEKDGDHGRKKRGSRMIFEPPIPNPDPMTIHSMGHQPVRRALVLEDRERGRPPPEESDTVHPITQTFAKLIINKVRGAGSEGTQVQQSAEAGSQ
jgi:hypothetical protein